MPRRYEIHGRVFGKGANPRAALRKTPSCRRAALAADSAQHRPFLRKLFNHTVAVIYCTISLPNGAAGDGRREEERRRGEDKRREEKRGKYDKVNDGRFQSNNFRRWNLNIMRRMPRAQSAEVVSASCSLQWQHCHPSWDCLWCSLT